MDYWSWWQGALALGGVTVMFVFMFGRMLGVSGSWVAIVNWREERQRQKSAMGMRPNSAKVQNALLAATLAEFGEQAVGQAAQAGAQPVPAAPRAHTQVRRDVWKAHLTFLLSMVVGGFIATFFDGSFLFRFDLGEAHTRLFGSGWSEYLVLFLGGVLVGFGTNMGSGCTSGHGLSGVSRLAPASLIATTAFFATAVAVTFVLERMLP